MINKLYTSISWPISAHPPVAAESRAHAPAGALITEPKELEVEIDCDWVEADWRAGIKPDDSTMSTRELITPNVYRRHHQQYNTLNMKWIDSSTQLSFFFLFQTIFWDYRIFLFKSTIFAAKDAQNFSSFSIEFQGDCRVWVERKKLLLDRFKRYLSAFLISNPPGWFSEGDGADVKLLNFINGSDRYSCICR